MNNVFFKEILIIDIILKKAKYVQFKAGLNVITSTENHVGKSSLVKSLYYCLGAEIEYDSTWDKNSKLYIVKIDVNGDEYTIARQCKNFIIFSEKSLINICKSVGKELAPELEKIFGFSVYLPGKKSNKNELAPPVFTYLPYYIDQDNGWGTAPYESFASLDQYKKNDRIKSLYYHLNVFTKSTVDIQAKIDDNKEKINEINDKTQKLQMTLETLFFEVKEIIPAETIEELELGLVFSKKKIENIINQVSESRNKIQYLQSMILQHGEQLKTIKEYNKLQIDAVENKQLIITCPRCGYELDKELYSLVRENYVKQNEDFMIQQIQLIISSATEKLDIEKHIYVELMTELKDEEDKINLAQNAYKTYIKQRGLADSIHSIETQLKKCSIDKQFLEDEIKKLRKQLLNLPNKKEVDLKYIEYTSHNIIRLSAWDAQYEGKIGLLKPLQGQGTLASKIILAQYIALFSTMDYFKVDNVRFPFVVDSPRSKEPSKSSSEEIINLILEIKTLPQIILATMDFDDFNISTQDYINIIRLTEKRALLNTEDYLKNEEIITDFIKNFKSIQN